MAYLTTTPIAWNRIAYLERLSAQRACGALVTFVGIVRGDQHGDRAVNALYYEAYAEMAEHAIDRLIQAAKARWALQTVQIQHRLGHVEVGQVSVVIIVASHHRAEAYAASQCLIEQIKQVVPIWKRELFDDGASQWAMGMPEILGATNPLGAVHADL